METKVCPDCDMEQSIENFSKNAYHCRECHKKSCKEWREKNSDKVQAYQQQIETIFKKLKRGAKKRGLKFDLTYEKFEAWYNSQEKICTYCDIPEHIMMAINWGNCNSYRMTVDRMDNNIGYTYNNITLACFVCNELKGRYLTFVQARDTGQRHKKQEWMKEWQSLGNK